MVFSCSAIWFPNFRIRRSRREGAQWLEGSTVLPCRVLCSAHALEPSVGRRAPAATCHEGTHYAVLKSKSRITFSEAPELARDGESRVREAERRKHRFFDAMSGDDAPNSAVKSNEAECLVFMDGIEALDTKILRY